MQRTRVLHQQRNRARPFDYSAYLEILLASLFKLFAHALGVDGRYDQNHSDPHIECSIHLLFAYVRGIAKNLKNRDRKSTRLNSSHVSISYAVFCLKKK